MTKATEKPYLLYAHIGSPYSMKIRALMRYRRIPHIVLSRMSDFAEAQKNVKVPVIPVLKYPEGSYKNDSTPLIFDLEERHQERSVIPENEGDAFLAFLIEDMADELLTKSMYAYRWGFPEHTGYIADMIAYDNLFGGGQDQVEKIARAFEARQIGRNAVVGCTPENMPLIMHVANIVLDAMESMVLDQPFLFGTRPSLADFAIFGQISQFLADLAAQEPSRSRAPFAMRWVSLVDDLSGLEGEWKKEDEAHVLAVGQLLGLVGSVYLPFLLANAEAFEAGAEQFEIEAVGMKYAQAPFKYQVKCLAELRKAYGALSAGAKAEVDPILEKYGCLMPLAQ
ncbi:MAG: glutathione S-transferase family protein [Chloroflexota bacterium]